MSGLFEDLQWRGLVHQTTDADLPKLIDNDSLTVYIGFDPTADSLHVGHLLQMCTLRRFQQAGHRPISLAGGGTGMIGDPGGKSEERNLLTREQLTANLEAIRAQLGRFLDFEAGAMLLDNGEWLWSIPLLDFLRDIGKHFTVNQMVAKESVRARLEDREQGISFTEFSYMLLQAYDFLRLFDDHGCRLQMGGSDQWGNITMGVDLIRRLRGEHAYGLTSPLVLKADGTKFGKTESGAVWLDPAKTTPYAFYQYFVRSEDAVVGQYLRYFTWLSHEEIEALDAATAEHPERREAQRTLAREVTALVHGADEAAKAEHAAAVLFTDEIASLDEATLLSVLADAPSATVAAGASLVDALVATGLSGSKGDARRALQQKGIYVNGRQQSEDRELARDDALHDRFVVLRRGKRELALVVLTG
ncbi:MAG TPA: tyrosine--tRNA ligase [Acidimicrobiales bacterium]|nr:tyrosine--tRNA ligase [Acidimicrobiales bacterium]